MERITVSLDAEQAATLRALAAAHDTTVSAVVRAAADALAAEHTAAGSIRRRIRPDARGGARPGAGRPRSDAGRAA
ncbi:MAG: ribbon-helix-helix protein, CopG family [Acidimicrobiia bacterium]|nr:ribbon-helix-helix protein, CopG family [Acidimicrobiia bacterium]